MQGCIADAPVPEPKEFKLGDVSDVGSYVVPVPGGIFYLNPSDTIHSVKITFPPNSFKTSKTLSLSKTRIRNSSFGENVQADSFLYSLDFGSELSSKNIILDIPIMVDSGTFTMAFLYDRVTHELDGIPTVGLSKTTPKRLSVILRRSGSFFTSSILTSKLVSSVKTAFEPKADNWEFPNYGTSITPNGQFAGQSLTALWYFYEHTLKGNPHLYAHFDNDHGGEKPKVWQDNVIGLRWAAQTQQNSNWDATAFSMITPIDNGNAVLTSRQLIYSMMVTEKPQLMTMVKDSTVLPLIVYKIESGHLFVADPNFPTATTLQPLGNKYSTAASMHNLLTNGTTIFSDATYIGVRALIDWDAIGKTFQTVTSDSVVGPYTVGLSDKEGQLKQTGGEYTSYYDTIFISTSGIQPSGFWIFRNGSFVQYDPSKGISLLQPKETIGIYGFTFSSNLQDTLWTNYQTLTINQGTFEFISRISKSFIENDVLFAGKMGAALKGTVRYQWDMGDGTPIITMVNIDNIKYRYKTIGTFSVSLSVWNDTKFLGTKTSTITIVPNSVTIKPDGQTALTGVLYAFHSQILVSDDIVKRYVWSMGDGSDPLTLINTDSILFTYKKDGTYTLILDIFDNVTNVLLGSDTATASFFTILPINPTLEQLQSMKHVAVEYSAEMTYFNSLHGGAFYFNQFKTINFSMGASDTDATRIIWNGNTFSARYSFSTYYNGYDTLVSGYNIHVTDTTSSIAGQLSDNFSKINISAYNGSKETSDWETYLTFPNHTYDRTENLHAFNCNLLYAIKITPDSIIYFASGTYLQFLAPTINDHNTFQRTFKGSSYTSGISYYSTFWTYPTHTPYAKVIFTK